MRADSWPPLNVSQATGLVAVPVPAALDALGVSVAVGAPEPHAASMKMAARTAAARTPCSFTCIYLSPGPRRCAGTDRRRRANCHFAASIEAYRCVPAYSASYRTSLHLEPLIKDKGGQPKRTPASLIQR